VRAFELGYGLLGLGHLVGETPQLSRKPLRHILGRSEVRTEQVGLVLFSDLVRDIGGLDWILARVSNGNETRILDLSNLQMALECSNQCLPPTLRLAKRVRILKAEHSHFAHHVQCDRIVLKDRNLGLHLDLQLIRAARCSRGKAGENAAPALLVLIDLHYAGGLVSRSHDKAQEDAGQRAKTRSTGNNGPPLPRDHGQFPEGYLILRVGEAVPQDGLTLWSLGLAFILIGQVGMFSPVCGWCLISYGVAPPQRDH